MDQSVGFASFSPRVMLNSADLPASGLVQEGSRIRYSLLVAGEAEQVANLRAWLQGRLSVGEKIEDVRDARPEIRTALDRAEHFLGLAALTAVVLAGVALALASRHFISRHLDACAMMRCLGANQAQVLRIFLYQFLLLGFCAVLLGELLGYLSQAALVDSIPSMRTAALPPPGWTPVWQAAASGMALLLGFAFLPLWQLKSVSPLRVIRRELGVPRSGHRVVVCVRRRGAVRTVPVAGRFAEAGVDRAGRIVGGPAAVRFAGMVDRARAGEIRQHFLL